MSQPAISPLVRPAAEASTLREGCYLTDDANLFRCISLDHSGHPDSTVLLEDCLSLAVIILPLSEVSTVNLRMVEPG